MTGQAAAGRWERIQQLFFEALDRPAAGRAAWVREQCIDDALADEVASLLEAHEAGGPVGERAADPPPAGGLVGDWRLVRLLGEGGMGTVYLAEREGADYRQTVALKLIRAGFVDRLLEARLRAERRILARLEHPGIARFIDGGATPAGQPYVAMEYVDGSPIDRWCDEKRLGRRERVRLFLSVCEAVQHAHQQLVVHRDLKPGNIHVTGNGRVKLLDFGIAKVLEAEPGEPVQAAGHTGAWITPAYASPEQVRGEPATTLTDVYALGVVLYELLAGRRPYEFPGLAMADVQRVVCGQEPDRPGLDGDLDVILLKALAKEPERRYASAEQLRDDLRRWLDDEPVLARPDSAGYRAAKFARRHRSGVIAAAVAAIALAGGLITTAWQAAVATRERNRAEAALAQSQKVTGFVIDLFETSSPEYTMSDTIASRALLRRGAERVDALAGQPLVQASLLDALGRIHDRLALFPRARDFLQRAVALRREAHGAAHPDIAASLASLSVVYRRMLDYRAADSLGREALAMRRRTLPPDHADIAASLEQTGYLAVALAELSRAESSYREALAIRVGGPDVEALTNTVRALASVVRRRGRVIESDSLYRRAVEIATASYGRDHVLVALMELHLGDQLLSSRPQEAESLFRHATSVQRRHMRPDDISRIHGLGSLSDVLISHRRMAEALALREEVVGIVERTYGSSHPEHAYALMSVAELHQSAGRHAAADSLHRRALATLRSIFGDSSAALAGSLIGMAGAAEARGSLARAEELYRQSLALRRRGLSPDHPLVASSLAVLGGFYRRHGNAAAALASYREALGVSRRSQLPEHPFMVHLIAIVDTMERRAARP